MVDKIGFLFVENVFIVPKLRKKVVEYKGSLHLSSESIDFREGPF